MWLKSRSGKSAVDCRVYADTRTVQLRQSGHWVRLSFEEWHEANSMVMENVND